MEGEEAPAHLDALTMAASGASSDLSMGGEEVPELFNPPLETEASPPQVVDSNPADVEVGRMKDGINAEYAVRTDGDDSQKARRHEGGGHRRQASWTEWSMQKIRVAKQAVKEKLGRSAPTRTAVDDDLNHGIIQLRASRERYRKVHVIVQRITAHFEDIAQQNRELAKVFSELAVHEGADLAADFDTNQTMVVTFSSLHAPFIGLLRTFAETLETSITTVTEDTLKTWTLYEQARLEYDAELSANLKADESLNGRRERLEHLRQAVGMKLKLLNENKVQNMKKQLTLFNRAVTGFYTSNQDMLMDSLAEFHAKAAEEQSEPRSPSWLHRFQSKLSESIAPS